MNDDDRTDAKSVRAAFERASRAQAEGRIDNAVAIYKRLLKAPDAPYAAIQANLSAAALAQKDWPAAEAAARAALAADPQMANAANNLGMALRRQGRNAEAIDAFEACLARNPRHDDAWANLSGAYRAADRPLDALQASEKAVLLAPAKYVERLGAIVYAKLDRGLWDNLDRLIEHVHEAIANGTPINPYLLLLICHDPAEMLRAGRARAAIAAADAAALPRWSPPPANTGRYRIGYFSSTLRAHATGFLIREIVSAHDRDRFEIIAYPYAHTPDHPFTAKLRGAFDRVTDLSDLSDVDALERIRADRLDVLLCVDGYADEPRSAISQARAAPAQVNWLGFPSTMGSTAIDYVIADETVLPPAMEPFFDETPVRLSNGYFPRDGTQRPSERFRSRADLGFPETGVLMGALNQARKLTPFMFDRWAEIMRAVEDAYLVLWETTPTAMATFRQALAERGVSADRAIATSSMTQADHLARYRFIDMFLDTWPCNGHTMTSDALYMGVPGVTLSGRTFASRVAASLLNQVGVGDLIAQSPADYVRLAVKLAGDDAFRSGARATIRREAARKQVFSGVRYAREFDAALAAIADRARAGLPPTAITI